MTKLLLVKLIAFSVRRYLARRHPGVNVIWLPGWPRTNIIELDPGVYLDLPSGEGHFYLEIPVAPRFLLMTKRARRDIDGLVHDIREQNLLHAMRGVSV